ncbi:nucleotidyltransferase [Candidatus Woesearchaeota archaeon]|nr:MAG: nucleotidyltransferase [Candidatus Woesearchaeota archaeon]
MENLTKEIILEEIEKNKQTLKKLGVKTLTLFGSFARDEQKKSSDIDFLVEFEEGRGLFDDYMGALHFLEELFNKKIDLVKPHLVKNALKPYILEGVKYDTKI